MKVFLLLLQRVPRLPDTEIASQQRYVLLSNLLRLYLKAVGHLVHHILYGIVCTLVDDSVSFYHTKLQLCATLYLAYNIAIIKIELQSKEHKKKKDKKEKKKSKKSQKTPEVTPEHEPNPEPSMETDSVEVEQAEYKPEV